MSEQTPNYTPEQEQEPLIPPQYLLGVAIISFIAALIVLFTQPEFGVVGIGALALGVISLLAWAFMAPDAARAVLTGRGARFGSVTVIVTLLVIIMLIAVYVLVRSQGWRTDLTERDTFSLTDASDEAIRTYAADPTLPSIRILAFYPQASAQRDQDSVLFDDYQETSGGKITYEFVDPDRNPGVASQYGVTRPNQIVVAPLDDAGEILTEEAEVVNFFSQDELTNAILKASAQGDFRVYVMAVEGGLTTTGSAQGSMTNLVSSLTDQFDWSVETVNFLDLARADAEIQLNDPATDGEVMMIVGGSQPLTEREMETITNYLDNGGSLMIFAGSSLNEEGESLASGELLSTYLWDNYGVRFRDDVVIDPVQYIQSPLLTVATDLNAENFISSNAIPVGQAALVLDAAQSIEVANTRPEGVTVDVLASSSENSYSETDLDGLREGTIEQGDADLEGPLNVAAVATDAESGAKVMLFSSTSLVQDAFSMMQSQGVSNLQVAFNSLLWATDFNEFFQRTNILSEPSPSDQPVFADQNMMRNINFLTSIALPFGVLALGILVWWNNRERAR